MCKPKVNIDWEEMTPKHHIEIPKHNHDTTGAKEWTATWYTEHVNRKEKNLIKRLFGRFTNNDR